MAGLKQKFEDAAIKLADARRNLATAQANFDTLFKQLKRGGNAAASGQPNEETELAENVSEQIINTIKSDPAKEWSYEDLETALPKIAKNSLRALLYKLKSGGKVEKAARGKWKAK